MGIEAFPAGSAPTTGACYRPEPHRADPAGRRRRDVAGGRRLGLLGRLLGVVRRSGFVRIGGLEALARGVVGEGEPRRVVDDQLAEKLRRLLDFRCRQLLLQRLAAAAARPGR